MTSSKFCATLLVNRLRNQQLVGTLSTLKFITAIRLRPYEGSRWASMLHFFFDASHLSQAKHVNHGSFSRKVPLLSIWCYKMLSSTISRNLKASGRSSCSSFVMACCLSSSRTKSLPWSLRQLTYGSAPKSRVIFQQTNRIPLSRTKYSLITEVACTKKKLSMQPPPLAPTTW